ncbi:hypothetical protein [Holospora curviuscula]|uniref:Uncharacterized protein n=1 Tax=Holospora curviuscula TaxID=1082868 RepID=A0A2S5RE29_9PROT|nr:hypothetical protein [Holospora curviuscula]PPE05548.1 hypothetical protein HCUR_00194 [Holospora curviuscula]
MKYTCLQDVLDEIYSAEYVGNYLPLADEKQWTEGFKTFGTKENMLSALNYYFRIWDQGERRLNWRQEEDGCMIFERAAWTFYYIFDSISFLKDPSIIPELMQYFPPEGDVRWPWTMEDLWTEMMLQIVANYWDFGPAYMPWLMRSLHLLHPGARWAASYFMSKMIFDTFYRIKPDQFPELLILDALPLGKGDLVLSLLENEILRWQEALKRAKARLCKTPSSEKEMKQAKNAVDSAKESLACAEYVRGQLLLLPQEVISIGHR